MEVVEFGWMYDESKVVPGNENDAHTTHEQQECDCQTRLNATRICS